jgi:hypothetical protein
MRTRTVLCLSLKGECLASKSRNIATTKNCSHLGTIDTRRSTNRSSFDRLVALIYLTNNTTEINVNISLLSVKRAGVVVGFRIKRKKNGPSRTPGREAAHRNPQKNNAKLNSVIAARDPRSFAISTRPRKLLSNEIEESSEGKLALLLWTIPATDKYTEESAPIRR